MQPYLSPLIFEITGFLLDNKNALSNVWIGDIVIKISI